MDGQTDGGDYNIPFAFLKSVGIIIMLLLIECVNLRELLC